jgi:hypothetical protein
MTEAKKNLLLAIVKKRAPESLSIAESFLAGLQLANWETDTLIHLINDEFLAEGIKPDFEPTALGLELESLLDDVNRRRLS